MSKRVLLCEPTIFPCILLEQSGAIACEQGTCSELEPRGSFDWKRSGGCSTVEPWASAQGWSPELSANYASLHASQLCAAAAPQTGKLATAAMNPHYHAYTELSSPHSPPPDNSSYHHHHHHHHHHHPGGPHPMSNGHVLGPGDHHPFGPPQTGPGAVPPSHPHHHHLNNSNNNNNNTNNNNNNGPGQGPGGNNSNNNCASTVKVCAGCGGKIVERFLLHALDRYWHNSCLKCSCCGAMLADIGTSCFIKANMILCKTDYIRLFGSTGACSGCGQTIPACEFVMRAGPQPHVFHLKCFACSKCGAQLVPGDRYCLLAGSLVCEQDWHKLLKGSAVASAAAAAAAATPARKGKVGRPRRSRD